MHVDFLEAADQTPLTKHFVLADGTLSVEPYPHVRDFISHRVEVQNLTDFHGAVQHHAALRHCLLKGMLQRPLRGESRAGLTNPIEPTEWLLLDLDFDAGWASVDDFIAELNPDWADVSYIWQHSSSAGIRYEPGLRGHLWLLLDRPMAPASIKLWLKTRNLTMPGLTRHLKLTATGMGLRYPLDITTCQNDKLIYIAPPVLRGLDDPLPERISLVTKARERAPVPTLGPESDDVERLSQEAVDELRRAAGLRRKQAQFRDLRHGALLVNPEQATVTGVRKSRGFVYLNLNGGDSWAYYFPENNPEFLYNFKDEPTVQLKALAPEFYQEFMAEQRRARFADVRPYVFRDCSDDTYYNMLYSPASDEIKMVSRVATKDRMRDFMAQYGYGMPDPIEDWTVVFDPTDLRAVNEHGRWVNLFQPTQILRLGKEISHYPAIPPVTLKILDSICAEDETTRNHFINWLAYVVQTRQRAQTAWIFHGVQGTGKGLLLSRILVPILGSKQVTEWTTKEFEDGFNTALQHTSLLWLDEFKATNSRSAESLMSRLKNMITEPTLPIRAMRAATVERTNWLNIIIASNYPDPVLLANNDRRFNVAPPQEIPLLITAEELSQLDDEVPLFASYLMHFDYDEQQVRTVLSSNARDSMIVASMTSQEAFFNACRVGHLDFFTDFLTTHLPSEDLLRYQRFETLIFRWLQDAVHTPEGEELKIDREELRDVFRYITGINATPAKFARMCNMYRLRISYVVRDGRRNVCIRTPIPLGFRERAQMLADQHRQKANALSVVRGGRT